MELVVVGRKTAGDGKLEVSADFARVLGGEGARFEVRVRGRAETGTVAVLECTCAKAAAAGRHEHHFVQCDGFRALPAGTELRLSAEHAQLEVELG